LTLALVLCFASFAATAQTGTAKSKSNSKTKTSDTFSSTSSDKSSSSGTQIDINSASKDELVKNLAGVGDVTADKIIAGRPYANKRQLVSKGIVTQKVYDKISSQIIAKQGSSDASTSSSGKSSATGSDSTTGSTSKKKKKGAQ
jgi:DNA uptake protein ComE-like DNA-binding protein